MRKMNLGIIGTGNRGRLLARSAQRIEGVNMIAAADPYEDNLLKCKSELHDGLRTMSDYHELLAMDDVDGVIIATPNATHTAVALDVLAAGKPIYLEKPMATTVNDCERIMEAAEKTGVPLMVGLQLRYSGVFRKVKELIDQGKIGQVRMIWCKEFRQPFIPGAGEWRLSQEASGGSLVEKNCHHFDLFNWFAQSNPVKVAAFGGGDVIYKGGEIVDNAWTIIEYENGVRANLGLCMFHKSKHDLEIGVIGDEGLIESFFKRSEIVVHRHGVAEPEVYNVKPLNNSGHGGTDFPAMEAFVGMVRGRSGGTAGTGAADGTNGAADLQAALDSVAIGIAAERAIAEGRVIELSDLFSSTATTQA
ncbi:MAG: gfo/Idh/MocA family oxidoreductase [Paenibacillaceae bacterium]|jgi:predicted dehydrogenase|nr:gfo/Idh/MocA family oxidoreductase [Paenibacillaceae bacterium]